MMLSVGKTKMINVRLSDQTHEDFKVVSELRGASMSSLLHQFIVKAIREEKDTEPQAFKKENPPIRMIELEVEPSPKAAAKKRRA